MNWYSLFSFSHKEIHHYIFWIKKNQNHHSSFICIFSQKEIQKDRIIQANLNFGIVLIYQARFYKN